MHHASWVSGKVGSWETSAVDTEPKRPSDVELDMLKVGVHNFDKSLWMVQRS